MDGRHFDTLTRSLTTASSRRRALAAFGGTLGLAVAAASADEAAAKKKKCPPCKKRKQGTCKKKKPDGTACPGGACQGGRCVAPTCTDGIKNGNETAVDCGGGCKRCGTGQGCTGRNDCASALCSGGTCQTCMPGSDNNCGGDAGGPCHCDLTHPDGATVCTTSDLTGSGAPCASSACPPGQICINSAGTIFCIKPCGAS